MESEKSTYLLSLSAAELEALRLAAELQRPEGIGDAVRELQYARPRTSEELADYGRSELQRSYYADVSSMAEELVSEALAEETDADSAREEVEERLWERVDGSSWVIYTASAIDVLRISENDSYSVDNFGTEGLVSESGIEWSRLAFGALYADVSERVHELLSEWEEARDAFEEDAEERGLSLDSFELRDVGARRYSEERGWEDGPADRYTLSIELPHSGDVHSWTMSADATSPAGVCQSTEGKGAGSVVSIVSPDVPDAVQVQALRLVDWIREELARELSDKRSRLEELRLGVGDEDAETEAEELAGRLSELREELEALRVDEDSEGREV